MVFIKFILLATALLAAVQTDAAGRRKHKPGTKRHSQGDDPASFYYLVRCEEAAGRIVFLAELVASADHASRMIA